MSTILTTKLNNPQKVVSQRIKFVFYLKFLFDAKMSTGGVFFLPR